MGCFQSKEQTQESYREQQTEYQQTSQQQTNTVVQKADLAQKQGPSLAQHRFGTGNKNQIQSRPSEKVSRQKGQLKTQIQQQHQQQQKEQQQQQQQQQPQSEKKQQQKQQQQQQQQQSQQAGDKDDDSDWDKASADFEPEPEPGQGQQGTNQSDSEFQDDIHSSRESSGFIRPHEDPFRETSTLRVDKVSGCMFVNQFIIVKYLGRGACGKVFLCLNTQDSRLYAMKVVQKVDLQRSNPTRSKRRNLMEDLRREIAIMKQMRHQNIVTLKEVIDDPHGSKILLVMEYMEGGPVLTRQALEKREKLPESLARQCFRDMVAALDYLHANKIVHGDLKPENVLMTSEGEVKLSDFGCSKIFVTGNEYLDRCNGTPAFLAPEMMKPQSRYRGRPTDVYAMGACLFTFVFGRIPFTAPNLINLFKIVQNEPLKFPEDTTITETLRELLDKMLVKDPKQRIQLREVMAHPWVTDNGRLPPLTPMNIQRLQTKGSDASSSNTTTGSEVIGHPPPAEFRRDYLYGLTQLQDRVRTFREGEILWKQRDIGAFMVYIISGQCDVLVKINQRQSNARPGEQQQGEEEGGKESRGNAQWGDTNDPEELQFRRWLVEAADRSQGFMRTIERDNEQYSIARRGAGEFIGEMVFFNTAGVRSATVRATSPMTVSIIGRDQLAAYLQQYPEAKHQLREIIWNRESELMMLEALHKLASVHLTLAQRYNLLLSGMPKTSQDASPDQEVNKDKDKQRVSNGVA